MTHEEKTEIIRKHWGGMTAKQIGIMAGMTSRSVSRHAREMGLPRIASMKGGLSYVRNKTPKPSVESPNDIVPPHARPWLTRGPGECAFAYGLKGNIHSCCRPVVPGRKWCAEHVKEITPAPEIDFRSIRKWL